MPVYDLNANTDLAIPPRGKPWPGALPMPVPCRTVDANGTHVPMVQRCNTETGELERAALTFGEAGQQMYLVDAETRRVLVYREVHPAPLSVQPLNGEDYMTPDTLKNLPQQIQQWDAQFRGGGRS